MIRTLTPISSILIALLLGIFFIQPEYTKVLDTQREIDEYQSAIEQYASFSALLEQKLTEKQNRSVNENEQLDLLVPEVVNSAQLLVDLEYMAESHSMLFGNILVTGGKTALTNQSTSGTVKEESRDELYTVDISFEVIGTYEQFKSYLRDIESSATLFEVTKITFAPTEDMFQQFSVTVRIHTLNES